METQRSHKKELVKGKTGDRQIDIKDKPAITSTLRDLVKGKPDVRPVDIDYDRENDRPTSSRALTDLRRAWSKDIEFTELAKKPEEVADEDKLFCLSLVNEIKKIPEHKRLRAKIDIYNLIAQHQNPSHSPSCNYSSKNYWGSQHYSSGYGYSTSGRDKAPVTPSSVATSNYELPPTRIVY
ncbi:unnamed protein product [Diatraea saccharalis]|uniref:BESS domain-containing protein n=1 Tax=Diatraea saccharalis TaxID=40085 RepID=A0A9N9RAP7_9NEOP|nr:unnamed protein product [Diatraea saccharalis]